MHKLNSKCLAPHSPSHKGQQKVKHNGSFNVFHKSNLTFIPTPYPLPLKVQDSQYTLYTHKLHHILLMAKSSMRRYSWDQIFFGRKREVYWIDEHMYRLWTHKYVHVHVHAHACMHRIHDLCMKSHYISKTSGHDILGWLPWKWDRRGTCILNDLAACPFLYRPTPTPPLLPLKKTPPPSSHTFSPLSPSHSLSLSPSPLSLSPAFQF